MSAGGELIDRDLTKLAPKFRLAVESAIDTCHDRGYDAMVWEAYRSPELAMLYYARGRPPTAEYPKPVTNAKTNLYSWHGYYLAVDVISRKEKWFNVDPKLLIGVSTDVRQMIIQQRAEEARIWFAGVATIFKSYGCDWGGDWTPGKEDFPHFQWGRLKPSPSDAARSMLATQGIEFLWRYVGAV